MWYYERRIPLDVIRDADSWQRVFNGKRLWRRSLQTRDMRVAIDRATGEISAFEALLADARGKEPTMEQVSPLAPLEKRFLTSEQYLAIQHREHQRLTKPWQMLSAKSNVDAAYAAKFETDSATYLMNRTTVLQIVKNRVRDDAAFNDERSPFGRARQINIDELFHINEASSGFGYLISTIRDAMLRADSDIVAIIDGAMLPPSASTPFAKSAAKANKALERRTPIISKMVETYLNAGGRSGGLTVRTKNGISQALKDFVAVVGDKQAHQVTRQDVRSFIEAQGAKHVGTHTSDAVPRPMAPATVKKKVTFLRSAFEMAIDRDTFEGDNPFTNVKLSGFVRAVDKAVMPEKRAFTYAELRALFSHPWFSGCLSDTGRGSSIPGHHRLNDSRFWGPVIALYTGCRAAELGGLRLEEVKLGDECPHIVIMPNKYRRTKSNKERTVPILDAVFALGFEQYLNNVRASGADRVFPDWLPPLRVADDGASEFQWASAKWPKAFNRTVLSSVLIGTVHSGVRQQVTLHSFRGAFKRLLEESGILQQYVDDIIGHEKHQLDKSYSGIRDIGFLYSKCKTLNYPNIGLTAPV